MCFDALPELTNQAQNNKNNKPKKREPATNIKVEVRHTLLPEL